MSVVTATAVKPASAPSIGQHDRRFYSSMAIALAATTLTGFASTYYLRFFDGGPSATISGGPFTTVVRLHGALFSAWVALFVAQTALISTRRVPVHRRLGVFGAALGIAMIVVGTFTAIAMARRGGAPPGIGPLEFLAVPLFDMVLFAAFLAAALTWRRDKETHKRLMLLAYASIMAAPAARLPGVLPLGPLAFYGIAFLVVVAGSLYDYLSRGRVHNAYIWGGALFFLSVPFRLALSSTAAWRSFAQALIE